MPVRGLAAALLLLSALLAGCSDGSPPAPDSLAQGGPPLAPALPGFAGVPLDDLPRFSEARLIDDTRAGGEPVIAITPAGTILVSSHPGYTHVHLARGSLDPPTEAITPTIAQSYMWRSTDGGGNWTHVGLPGLEAGPRGPGLGVGDPDFTVMADGTVCFTDLESLVMASVSCSTDDGETWLAGNPIASGGPIDRQWLASHGGELYFTGNYLGQGHLVQASSDLGLTWRRVGEIECQDGPGADFVATPDGTLVSTCGGLTSSTDGGQTWTGGRGPSRGGGRDLSEPAVDGAGTVWTLGGGASKLSVAGTPDLGKEWPWKVDLTPHVALALGAEDHTFLWPWISAGSEGRLAVTWIGANESADPAQNDADWHLYSAHVVNATGTPMVAVTRLAPEPIHHGPICQDGTTCQVRSMAGEPRGDRRLGDFFETTIDADGSLHVTVSNTAARPQDAVSHVLYVRQVGGLPLVSDEDRGSFLPRQG